MSNLATVIKTDRDAIKLGMSGDVIKKAQLALAEKGYSLKGTGYFGNATLVAVNTVQKNAGIAIDGELGPTTAKIIDFLPSRDLLPPIKQQEISRPLWLEAGIKLIGVKETQGKGDTKQIIDWAKEEGGNIAKAYTHDEIPWCALFANHILTSVGIQGTETLWALDFAGKWPSVRLIGPAVGAFAPMTRNGGGHITTIIGKDQNGNVMGLGGNQHDEVNITPFTRSRFNQGFWWPKSVPIPPSTQIGYDALPLVKSNGQLSNKET